MGGAGGGDGLHDGKGINKQGKDKEEKEARPKRGGINDFPTSPHQGGGAALWSKEGRRRAPPGWEEGLSPTQRLRERIQEDTRAREKRQQELDRPTRLVQSTLRGHWGGSRLDKPAVEPKEPERAPPPPPAVPAGLCQAARQ